MKKNKSIPSKEVNNHYTEFLSHYLLPSPASIMDYFTHSPGKLIVIGARPAMGKTSLMLSLTKSRSDCPVLIISLELSETQLEDRYLALSKDNRFLFPVDASLEWLGSGGPDLFNCSADHSLVQIRSLLLEQRNDVPVKVVFIDYIQLIKETNPDYLTHLKSLAAEFQLAIVAFSQLENTIDAKPMFQPNLEGLLRYDPDISQVDDIYYLVRPDRYGTCEDEFGYNLCNHAVLYGLKGAFQGKRGLLKFNGGKGRFKRTNLFKILSQSNNYSK
ncbi:MAG: DnaB-like helicase C-terminal domain-containing protein [Mariniphaga sp.]